MSSKSQNAIQLLSSKREPWRRKISWSSASAEIQRCSDNCFEAWPPLPVLSASCRTALQSSSIHNFNDEDERLYVLDNLPSFEFSGFKSSGIFWLSASWPWLGCITCLATVGGISRAVGHTIPIILKMVSENGIWGYPTLEKPILCFIFSWWTSFEVGSSGFVIVQIASFRRPSEILCNLPAKLDFTAWHIVPRQDDAVFTMDMKKTAFYRISHGISNHQPWLPWSTRSSLSVWYVHLQAWRHPAIPSIQVAIHRINGRRFPMVSHFPSFEIDGVMIL